MWKAGWGRSPRKSSGPDVVHPQDSPVRGHVVALAGATGVVGRSLAACLDGRSEVARTCAPGRRALEHAPASVDCPKLDRIEDEAAWTDVLPDGIELALCALGTTIRRAGSRAAFRLVDRDAVLAFARAARARGAKRFGLVSSIGAGHPGAAFYLRTKHEAEQGVLALGFARVVIVRPSFIDDAGTREEFRPLERLSLPLARLLLPPRGKTADWAPVSPTAIAGCLVDRCLSAPPGVHVVENREMLGWRPSAS